MASSAIAVVGLVVGAFSANEERKASDKGRRDQRRAERINAKKADAENAKKRRQQVAASRRARAEAVSQAESSGISGGSQVSGVTSSIGTQAAGNISFLNQLEGFDRARFSALSSANKNFSDAANARSNGQTAQQAIQVGASFHNPSSKPSTTPKATPRAGGSF